MLRCPNCMSEMAQNNGCSRCGYPDISPAKVPNALAQGTVIGSRFELGLVRQDSFQSIAYIAWDRQLQMPVVVTEFFPRNQAVRKNGLVMPRRFPALYQQACAMYVNSQQPMPLPLIAALAENGTAYRVYQLTAETIHSGELIDRLLDAPVYFRSTDQKPLMNVCALEIPPMPTRREWRQPEHEVIAAKPRPAASIESAPMPSISMPENTKPAAPVRNRRGLKIAVAAASAAILATLGATAFFILQKHNVTIEIETHAGITAAKIGTQQLPAATPDENGLVAYTVQLKNGSYTFAAEGDNGMTVAPEEIQVLSADVTHRLVLPDPTATPVPVITPVESQWLYADRNNSYHLISANGQEEVSGVPECRMYSYKVVLTNYQKAADALFSIAGKAGDVPFEWTEAENGSAAYSFQASEDSCQLCLFVDSQWKTIASMQADNTLYVEGEAIGMRNVLKDGILFVGEQNSAHAELTVEKLNHWAAEYPELYGQYQISELHLSLDERMNDPQVTIEGMAWAEDLQVCLAGDGWDGLSCEITSGDASFRETLMVEDAIGKEGWVLGQVECNRIQKKWDDACIVLSGNSIILPQQEAERAALEADMKDFPGVFDELLHPVSIEIDGWHLKLNQIASVQINGSDIEFTPVEDKWRTDIEASNEEIDLCIHFKNGLERNFEIAKTGLFKIDLFDEWIDCKDLFEATSVAVFQDETVYLKDQTVIEDEDQLKMLQMCENFHFDDRNLYEVHFTADERIKPEKVTVTLAGRSVEERSKLSAGEYQLEITIDGRKPIHKTITVSAEAENSYHLLKTEADAEVRELVLWGTDEDMLRAENLLLTEEAIQNEWNSRIDGGKLFPVTLELPNASEYKWFLKDEKGRSLQLNPGNAELLVMLEAGQWYTLSAKPIDGEDSFTYYYKWITNTSNQTWTVTAADLWKAFPTEVPATSTPAPPEEVGEAEDETKVEEEVEEVEPKTSPTPTPEPTSSPTQTPSFNGMPARLETSNPEPTAEGDE